MANRGGQIWAHSTIRTNPQTHHLGVRTRLYQHPSFSKAAKSKNIINPQRSAQTKAVYSYHRGQFGHRTLSYGLAALGGVGVAVPVVRGMKARRGLRPVAMRRSFILGTQRYKPRTHGARPVVLHPANVHLRRNALANRAHAAHAGHRNVRVRRGAHGRFAGSY